MYTRFPLRGFTLIELMIAVVIMAVLATLAVPSFRDAIANSQIRTAVESISAGIQQTRADAIAQNVTKTYTVPVETSVGAANAVPEAVGVVLNASAASVDFNPWGRSTLGAVMTIDASKPGSGTCLSSGGRLRCLRLVISTSGYIKMCDPDPALTGTPRGC